MKATDAIIAGSVLKASKKKADDQSLITGTTVQPVFIKRIEAQEEADRLNIINQLVIGKSHKQGGQRHHWHHPTNSWWQRPQKSGRLHLYEVMKAATKGAYRPTATDVLEQVIEDIHHPFDFRKKVSVNMELMQSNTARMATYGIVIGIPQLTLTLRLANIETSCKAEYGREFPKIVPIQPLTRCDITAVYTKRIIGSRWGARTQIYQCQII